VNAKYYLQLEGLPITLHTRSRDSRDLTPSCRLEVAQFRAMSHVYLSDFSCLPYVQWYNAQAGL
jgi:4-hydroxy-tetrahydrodipicolinate synthase